MKITQLTTGAVLTATLIGIGASVAGAQETLRSLAEERGRYVGAILNSQWFSGGLPTQYEQIHKSEFNVVVAENEMKFDATEPSQNNFNFRNGDRMVEYAKANKMRARGHALAWHSQVPGWVNNIRGKEQLLGVLKNHIEKTVGHFKGQIDEWDVVNEAVNDDQKHGWRSFGSVWFQNIGAEFLDSAFVWAHKADPDAELCYNDYAIEQGIGQDSKAGFVLDRVKYWVEHGIPITCVGSQTHVEDVTTAKEFIGAPDSLRHFAQELAKLGIKLNITELDVGFKSGINVSKEDLARQGQVYRQFMDVFLEEPNMGIYLIWGVSDKWSWLGGLNRQKGLIYDDNLNKKPAYDSIMASLKAHAPETVFNPYKSDFTKIDSLAKADSLAKEQAKADSIAKEQAKADSIAKAKADSLAALDTTKQVVPDSSRTGLVARGTVATLGMSVKGRTLAITGAKNAKVEVFNLQGAPVFTDNAVNGSVSLSKLTGGLYVVRVSAGVNSMTRRVILK